MTMIQQNRIRFSDSKVGIAIALPLAPSIGRESVLRWRRCLKGGGGKEYKSSTLPPL